MATPDAHRATRPRPRFEVATIAALCGDELDGSLMPRQRQALCAILRCRTAALGGHLDVCDRCDLSRPSYNSCRDRHCPKCQAVAQHRWLEARRRRILPVHHFHVVFTLPAELRALLRYNGSLLFDTLFRAATSTLLTLGKDPARLGAKLGITAVLHTWSRDLSFHPHLHCVVTGGGLDDDGRWKATRPGYLFPVRVLGKMFRGKFLAAVRDLHRRGKLHLDGPLRDLAPPGRFDTLIDRLHQKPWLVYCKPPFGSADAVYAYLGRYTHRIAISNRRIVDVRPDAVTFVTRDGKTTTLPSTTFLRRFLSHVLPKGFVRIRHYGLLASSHVHTSLETARQALAGAGAHRPSTTDDDHPQDDDATYVDILRRLTGFDLRRCPRCRTRSMRPMALPIPAFTAARGPPR
jgi:hypothetical protein